MSTVKAILKRVPKSFQVGPTKIDIVIDEAEFHKHAKDQDPSDAYGYTYFFGQKVYMDPNQGDDNLAETSLHETLHCVAEHVGLKEIFSDGDEEKFIAMISPTLLDVMRRNKDLVMFWIGDVWLDS